MRKIFLPVIIFVSLMLVSLLFFSNAPAQEEGKKAEKVNDKGYAGVEICQTCHEKQ